MLYVRTPEGKKRVKIFGFKPYFYVPDNDGEFISLDNRRVKKVVCNYPEEVSQVRDNYAMHYEANILFVHRFMIDAGIYEGIEFEDTILRYDAVKPADVDLDYILCYVDIEVANKGTPITKNYVEEAEDPIIAFTIHIADKYLTEVWRPDLEEGYEKRENDWYVVRRKSEQDLLMDFATYLEKFDPDIIIAWNSSDFDLPYLRNRMKKLGINFDWFRYAEFDLMHAYASFVLNKRNKYVKLKDVAIEEGIISPDEKEEFAIDWWRFDIEHLITYNKRDVEIMVELDKKRNLFNNARMRRVLSGAFELSDTFSALKLIDSACLREAKTIRVALPTNPIDKKTKTYEGGYVYQPSFGVYNNVAVFDFSRYYPSIMLSFKLDPLIYYRFTARNGKFDIAEYLKFAMEQEESIVLKPLIRFMKMRDEIDAQLKLTEPGTKEYERLSSMKQAVKGIINAFYGVCGSGKFRAFSFPIAEATTALGREGTGFVMKYIKDAYDFRVLYGDTDSIMIQVPRFDLDLFMDLSTDISNAVNEYFHNKYGVETAIKIKFEKFFRTIFFKNVKKRYAYHCVFEDDKECDYIGYKGFEIVKEDTSAFTKELQKEMFEIILKDDPRKLASWLPEKVKEFKRAKLSEIAIPKGINKPFDQYESEQAHVRGAIYANAHLGETIVPGRTVYFLYVREIKGKPKTDVVSLSSPERFDELTDIIEVDYDRMIERSIINIVDDVFRGFGIPLSTKGKQLTL